MALYDEAVTSPVMLTGLLGRVALIHQTDNYPDIHLPAGACDHQVIKHTLTLIHTHLLGHVALE